MLLQALYILATTTGEQQQPLAGCVMLTAGLGWVLWLNFQVRR